jgi:hypothetical protein
VQRIHSSPVPPLGRADVPESLELVLATAMSKAPESRYASAHTLALALQRIQNELSLSVTPFEVLEEPSDDDDPDSSYEETRVRGVVAINPHGPRAGAAPAGASGLAAVPGDTTAARDTAAWGDTAARGDTGRGDTVLRGRAGTVAGAPEALRAPGEAAEPEADPTVLRGGRTVLRGRPTGAGLTGPGEEPEDGSRGDAEDEERAAAARRRRTLLASSAAGVVLVAAVGAAIVLAPGIAGRPAPNQTTYSAPPVDAVDTGAVPNVTELKGAADASGVTFTWKNPQPRPGDAYLVTVLRLTGQQPPTTVTATKATVPKEASGQTCVRVVVRRSDGAAGPMDDSAPSACVSTK